MTLEPAQTEVFSEIAKAHVTVCGVKVQIWTRFNEPEFRWDAACPNLAGVEVHAASYDEAVGACLHRLCERVNSFKNAHQPVPWIDIGNRTPNRPDTIVLRKGVS